MSVNRLTGFFKNLLLGTLRFLILIPFNFLMLVGPFFLLGVGLICSWVIPLASLAVTLVAVIVTGSLSIQGQLSLYAMIFLCLALAGTTMVLVCLMWKTTVWGLNLFWGFLHWNAHLIKPE